MDRKKAVIIGSGIGGLALGIRLQSLGFDTTILEKLASPGAVSGITIPGEFTVGILPCSSSVQLAAGGNDD
jgi:phytoene desaturase